MRARVALALAFGLLTAALGRSARAEDLDWNWPHFRPVEYAATGVASAASLGVYLFVPNAEKARFTGGLLLDEPLRSVLRLRTPHARGLARFTSDLTAAAALNWTIGIDSLLVPLLRKNPDVAGQLTLLDAEAFAFSTLLANSIFKLVGRGRPAYIECERDANFDSLCHINDTTSFPSGHTNIAFTAAGLSCAHHLNLPLYGDRTVDILACSGSLVLATTTGTLRMLGDRHYVSDVLMGALIGFGVGYGVPTLLHYNQPNRELPVAGGPQMLNGAPPLGPSFSGTF